MLAILRASLKSSTDFTDRRHTQIAGISLSLTIPLTCPEMQGLIGSNPDENRAKSGRQSNA
jgi:hypothetical protein